MIFLFLLFIPLSLSQSSAVVLVTASVHFDQLISATASISQFGMRQAYLIGQELQTLYPALSQVRIFSDSSYFNSQTALGLLKGIYSPGYGPLVESREMQEKAVPPIDGFNFSDLSHYMRDQALPHYFVSNPIQSLIADEDILFRPDKACESMREELDIGVADCNESSTAKEACKAFEEVCNINIEKAYNVCECFNAYNSALLHNLTKRINDPLVEFMENQCDEYQKNLLKNVTDSGLHKLLTEKLFDLFEDNLNSTNKLSLYVISELQMKAVIYRLALKFPIKLQKYGSMVIIGHHHNNLILSLNKEPLKMLDKDSINYTEFVNWIHGQRLSNYDKACTPSKWQEEESGTWILLLVSLTSAGLLAIIVVAIILIRYCKRKKAELDVQPGLDNSEEVKNNVHNDNPKPDSLTEELTEQDNSID